ncbi:MAG TPA: protein kinase [Myxococcaceae bacterium]|nr:protein kinase [Myxococcaceae bacterium]
MPPKVIGPYRVLDTLGSGGAGTVYRALDRRTGEPVALKLLSTGPALDPRAARRLAREFETLAELSHPNVVKVFDTGVHHGYPYLAMELVEGLTLRNYLELDLSGAGTPVIRPATRTGDEPSVPWNDTDTGEFGPAPFTLSTFAEEPPSEEVSYSTGPASVRALADAADEPDTQESREVSVSETLHAPPVEQAPAEPMPRAPDLTALNRPERTGRLKDAMTQLASALSYIHGHGLVHRDLKPSNVMVDEDRLVRLMDFGLAKFLADDGAVTADGRLVGTFRYMAPEQILGEGLDARADLYSLGVILYEMLTGRTPFDARTPHELWQKVLETDAAQVGSINPGADAALARIAHRLLRKEPAERFQTAEEVAEALAE